MTGKPPAWCSLFREFYKLFIVTFAEVYSGSGREPMLAALVASDSPSI